MHIFIPVLFARTKYFNEKCKLCMLQVYLKLIFSFSKLIMQFSIIIQIRVNFTLQSVVGQFFSSIKSAKSNAQNKAINDYNIHLNLRQQSIILV